MNVDCATATSHLVARQRGELPEDLHQAVEAHVAGCPSCRAVSQDLRLLQRVFGASEIAAPPRFAQRVLQAAGCAQSVETEALSRDELRRIMHDEWRRARAFALRARRSVRVLTLSVAFHAAALLLLAFLVVYQAQADGQRERLIAVEVDTSALARLDQAQVRSPESSGGELRIEREDLPPLVEPNPTDENPSSGAQDQPGLAGRLHRFDGLRLEEDPENPFVPIPRSTRIGQQPGLQAARGSRSERERILSEYGYASVTVVMDAIDDGLEWLAERQQPDGSWDVVAEGGHGDFTVGISALALLAFLGQGQCSAGPHPYSDVVERGVAYLEKRQETATGRIGAATAPRAMYNHGIATIALLENYGMVSSRAARPLPDGSAQRQLEQRRSCALSAFHYLLAAQLASDPLTAGGWGYTPDAWRSDTSVSSWQVQALFAYEQAARSQLTRGEHQALRRAFQGVNLWLTNYTDPATGRVGYDRRNGSLVGYRGLTAMGLTSSLMAGSPPDGALARRQVRRILDAEPSSDRYPTNRIDFCEWYYEALALNLAGETSPDARSWNRRLVQILLDCRIQQGPDRGGWPAVCRWGVDGGRVYTTAMAVLILQTPYRFHLSR